MRAKKWDRFPPKILGGYNLEASAIYRRFLDKRFSRFTLAGLVSDDEPVLLRQIYVPLVLTPEAVSDQAPEERIHEGGREVAEWLADAVSQTLDPPTFYISGEAGSGKTTLTTSVVTSLAGTYPDEFNRRFERYLPFPILLRDVPVDRIGSLDELIDWWLAQAKEVEPDLAPEHVLPFLDYGYGILLLDGLDEVGSLERRERVLGWLRDHRWTGWIREKPNLTFVTARPSGFEGTDLRRRDGHMLHVAPFSVEQVRTFLTKWFELRPLSPTRRKESVESLIERLVSDDRMTSLRALSRRPAYLASLAFVHGTRGALPHTRAALYESVVDAYIDVLDRQRGIAVRNWDRQEKREVLAAVAFEAHVGATNMDVKPGDEPDRRFSWNRIELERAVRGAIDKGKARFRTIRIEDARDLTQYYIARTGLIVESREGLYQFGHLSFQEYLAALYALDRASGAADRAKALEKLLIDRLGKPGWVEVTLLALATDAARSQGMGHRAVLARLDPMKPEHIAFLHVVLSGEELPLGAEERQAWLLAYLLRAGIALGRANYEHFVELEANRATLEEAWQVVAKALVAGTSPVEALAALLPQESVCVDDDESRPVDPMERPSAWVRDAPSTDDATFGARVLAVPLHGSLVPSGARDWVLRLAATHSWFDEASDLPGIAMPHVMWLVLNAWTDRTPDVLPLLVVRLPFGWLCADNFFDFPSTLAARWDESPVEGLVRVRQETWKSVLAAERWSIVPERRTDWARDANRARARALHVPLAHNVRLAQNQHIYLPLSLALARARTLANDRDLVMALARDLPLRQGRDLELTMALFDLCRRKPFPARPWFERATAAISTFYLALTLNQILGDPAPTPRAVIEAERIAMADPDYLGRTLTDPADRAQARKEWTDFLRSPLSPLPMLDTLLATDFTEIDASTKAVTERFERTAAALLREAGAPVPEEPSS